MDIIFQILDDHDVKATFFCLGWIAKKYPEIIKKIDALGYEIGSHSNMHQLAFEMTPDAYEEDLKTSIFEIEDIIGKKVKYYRAPGFSIKRDNLWAFESLINYGITVDSSIFPAKRAHGGISSFSESKPCMVSYNGINIKEFPINTMNFLGNRIIFSGGGYFRLFPYSLIHHESKKTSYVMTYFHPRDFDSGQPILDGLSRFRKFKSYYGLSKCEPKLRQWLSNFEFIDLSDAIKQVNWRDVKKIDLN
jgi:polysaccharide deacetylase family protein (PEP-CTERM system associated)